MSDEGVDVPDIFRRPGNTTEQKKLIKKLTDGKPVKFSDYNFYTLASVIKVRREAQQVDAYQGWSLLLFFLSNKTSSKICFGQCFHFIFNLTFESTSIGFQFMYSLDVGQYSATFLM